MRGALCSLVLCLTVSTFGCTTGRLARVDLGRAASPDALAGWDRLADGRGKEAAQVFEARLATHPADALARFGRATLAYDRGDSQQAFDDWMFLIEQAAEDDAGAGDAWAPLLAAAAAGRIGPLFEDLADRSVAEDRVFAVRADGLPWPARLAVAELGDEFARRRGDRGRLGEVVRQAGCVPEATFARVGRLPVLDLQTAAAGAFVPAQLNGCHVMVPATDGLPGVLSLRVPFDVPAAGRFEVVVAAYGQGALRIDEGDWRPHGAPERFGPRASGVSSQLKAGRHTLEVRLGNHGLGADVTILVGRALARDLPDEDPVALGAAAAFDVARASVAALVGDTDELLGRLTRIDARPRFAAGFALGAQLYEVDPTRPAAMVKDAARAWYRRALALDPGLVRPHMALAEIELQDSHPREALEHAVAAFRAAPRLPSAALLVSRAHEAQGFEVDADNALDRALALIRPGRGGCAITRAAIARAERRHDEVERRNLEEVAARCDARADDLVERARAEGSFDEARDKLRKLLPTATSPGWVHGEIGAVELAAGRHADARRALDEALALAPRDTTLKLRLADLARAAGDPASAGTIVAQTLARFPGRPDVRQAARALGLPLPLADMRIDGRAVIAAFERGTRRWQAPAVMLLDRTVERVQPDGARIVLTHNIVKVQTKDGIDRWSEIPVPGGAEVLTLRTIKADGHTREPEEIAGKDTISAPDVEVGDYVEWEFIEYEDPAGSFAPGFMSTRFFFQSFEAPLDRSEYLLLTPSALPVDVDTRGQAPAVEVTARPDGTTLRQWRTQAAPQFFAERAAVPPVEWLPSVRASSGISLASWSRVAADRLSGLGRATPSLRKLAARLSAGSDGTPAATAARIVRWVTDTIESEERLDEPASFAVARGRGSRLAVTLALTRLAGIEARPVLVRSRLVADPAAPVLPQELDAFGDLLLWLPSLSPPVFVDVRLRHAPFGYVAPALAGAPAVTLGDKTVVRVTSTVADQRTVAITGRLQPDGKGALDVTETLVGWPALEWAELSDRVGADRAKLRQEFEERWLGQQFPGAQLEDLKMTFGAAGGATVRYQFTLPQLGVRDGTDLIVVPGFFRAQPGRRYATESLRKTPLQLGYDVPLSLHVDLTLPPGTNLVEAGRSGDVEIDAGSGARFSERRSFDATASRLVIDRTWRLPFLRVKPDRYPELAATLRKVDPLENGRLRVRAHEASR